METKTIIQTYLTCVLDVETLERRINSFCETYNIGPSELVDIKLSESEKFYTAMIIYKKTITI